MPAHTAHAQENLPPHPLRTRKPLKRPPPGEKSVMFEKPAAPKRAAPAPAPAPEPEPSAFWTHVDGLLENLPVKAAAQALGTKTKALGRDALASVASITTPWREWRKGSAPPPPKVGKEPVIELGSVLIDLHVAEVRRATDAFVRTIVEVAQAIDDAETAREISCSAACEKLMALLGEELVSEAMGHEPSQVRMVEMHAKLARLSDGDFARALALLGSEWQRDPSVGAGKLVLTSNDWHIAVDVAFATFRIRDRNTWRHVDVTGAPVESGLDANAFFTATHFRIAT